MRPDDHRTDRAMPGSGTEFSRDEWIVAIADHGVDPTDMPGRVAGHRRPRLVDPPQERRPSQDLA